MAFYKSDKLAFLLDIFVSQNTCSDMNNEVDFLHECDKVLYWIYGQLPQSDPGKEFFDPDIKEHCLSNGITHSADEILDKLAIERLIEGRGKGFVRMQNGGRAFCRQVKR